MEMDEREQLAALEGWSVNKAVPLEERLAAAQQVIRGLRKFLDGCPFPYAGQHFEECECAGSL